MAAVWKLEGLSATEKLVLLKLADCCDDQGLNAFPNQNTIAQQCGMTDRTVREVVPKLEQRGLIHVQSRRGPRPTMYHVLPNRPEAGSALNTPRPEQGSAQTKRQAGNLRQIDRKSTAARPEIYRS